MADGGQRVWRLRSVFVGWLDALRSATERIFEKPVGADLQDPDEIDHMRSWSISSGLAALPEDYAAQVPADVWRLIQAAKDLHPRTALFAVTCRARRDLLQSSEAEDARRSID